MMKRLFIGILSAVMGAFAYLLTRKPPHKTAPPRPDCMYIYPEHEERAWRKHARPNGRGR